MVTTIAESRYFTQDGATFVVDAHGKQRMVGRFVARVARVFEKTNDRPEIWLIEGASTTGVKFSFQIEAARFATGLLRQRLEFHMGALDWTEPTLSLGHISAAIKATTAELAQGG